MLLDQITYTWAKQTGGMTQRTRSRRDSTDADASESSQGKRSMACPNVIADTARQSLRVSKEIPTSSADMLTAG